MEIKKEKILVVKNLTVKYGLVQQPVIKNFNLEIDKGDHSHKHFSKIFSLCFSPVIKAVSYTHLR